MTYLDYLNQFSRWLETGSPTDKAIVLYYSLLDTFNRRGWPRWTGVDTQRLLMLARTTDKKVAFRARELLVNAGLISFKPGKKGRATEYCLNPLSGESLPEKATENATKNATQSATGNATPHNKTKKKTKTKKDPPIPPNAAELGFGPELTEAFQDWLSYKQERREMYKPTGLKNLIAQIQKHAEIHGESAISELIRVCMASNWRGIIWDRLQKPPEKQRDRYLYDYENTEGSW